MSLTDFSETNFFLEEKIQVFFILLYSGLATLTINSTKNHETFGSKVGVYLVFFHVTEE